MALITSCLTTHKQNIQCKYHSLSLKLNKSLRYGTKNIGCLARQAKIINGYLGALYCYKTFDADPTFAAKLVFEKDNSDSETVTLSIGLVTIGSYTGTGDGEAIAIEFENDINDNTTSPDYSAERTGSTVYIYSSDSSLSYSTTITVDAGSDFVTTDVDDDYEDSILDLWNDITNTEMCAIINSAYEIMPTECN